nr:MAG TPA: Photosystem II protein D1 1 II, Time resolved, Free [Caudoviricetes sp.]
MLTCSFTLPGSAFALPGFFFLGAIIHNQLPYEGVRNVSRT